MGLPPAVSPPRRPQKQSSNFFISSAGQLTCVCHVCTCADCFYTKVSRVYRSASCFLSWTLEMVALQFTWGHPILSLRLSLPLYGGSLLSHFPIRRRSFVSSLLLTQGCCSEESCSHIMCLDQERGSWRVVSQGRSTDTEPVGYARR